MGLDGSQQLLRVGVFWESLNAPIDCLVAALQVPSSVGEKREVEVRLIRAGVQSGALQQVGLSLILFLPSPLQDS